MTRALGRSLRAIWHGVGWLGIAAVIYLSLTPSPPQPPGIPGADKLAHIGMYLALALWLGQLYRAPRPRLGLAGGLIALGVALELVQGVTATRALDPLDALANALGVLIGIRLTRGSGGRILSALERRLSPMPGPGDAHE